MRSDLIVGFSVRWSYSSASMKRKANKPCISVRSQRKICAVEKSGQLICAGPCNLQLILSSNGLVFFAIGKQLINSAKRKELGPDIGRHFANGSKLRPSAGTFRGEGRPCRKSESPDCGSHIRAVLADSSLTLGLLLPSGAEKLPRVKISALFCHRGRILIFIP